VALEEEILVRVVIVGVGNIGRELAVNLSHRGNVELVLIDADEGRCEELAGELDALVLQGDGTDPEILKKARVAEADALVATTGSDAMNTVIAMLGHRMGVQNIIVKLNGVGLRAACQEIGVRKIIAPKISAAAEILASLYGFDRLDFSLVVRGGLRLVELSADGAVRKRIAELELPGGALVVAVLRGDDALVPRGQTKLEEGDVLLVLVESGAVLEKVRKLLSD
jgi:trk system potassium uptake protein TrkA